LLGFPIVGWVLLLFLGIGVVAMFSGLTVHV
jgi:hypothetical protein